MNNKAQLGIGAIVTIAIAVIVCLILFQSIATNVEQGTRASTGAIDLVNKSYTLPAANGTLILVGQELVTTPVVKNSSGATLGTTNYTISECVRTSDGLKGICYVAAANAQYGGGQANVSYQYYPDGYIDDAGARSVAGIIILLVAIGIAMVVLAGNKFDWY